MFINNHPMMLIRLSQWINKRSNTGVAQLALVIFILFTILVLPGRAQDAGEAGAGTGRTAGCRLG